MSQLISMIEFCNDNSGVLSMVLSVIAIIVSVKAISAQNKATLFEKRLEIYCNIEAVYSSGRKILHWCESRDTKHRKRIIMSVMFNYGEKEFDLIKAALDLEESMLPGVQEENKEKETQIMDLAEQYIDICLMKSDGAVEQQLKLLFYNQRATEIASKLYSAYEGIRFGFILAEDDNIEKSLKELREIIDQFENEKVLKYLKNDLPL